MNDRKRQVITVAKELFIKKGVITTSVQDIINEAKISKGTFYNYFSSKSACLIAILEQGNDETSLRRREILSGQDPSDKRVLAKQISIHLLVHREHNLIPIFQAIYYSDDQDLKAAVKRYQFEELAWLTRRLVDVYGKESATVAPDCAVMLYGIIQHLMHIRKNWAKKGSEPTDIIDFAIRRTDAMMADMIQTKDTFLEQDIFLNINENKVHYPKSELIRQMRAFISSTKGQAAPENNQLIQFMIDEIQAESPRIPIIESVNRSFREVYSHTDYGHKAKELSAKIWAYIDTLK